MVLCAHAWMIPSTSAPSASDRYIEGALLHDAPARTARAERRRSARPPMPRRPRQGAANSTGAEAPSPQSQSYRIRIYGAHVGGAAVFWRLVSVLRRMRKRSSTFFLITADELTMSIFF